MEKVNCERCGDKGEISPCCKVGIREESPELSVAWCLKCGKELKHVDICPDCKDEREILEAKRKLNLKFLHVESSLSELKKGLDSFYELIKRK